MFDWVQEKKREAALVDKIQNMFRQLEGSDRILEDRRLIFSSND